MKIFHEFEKKYQTTLSLSDLSCALGIRFGPCQDQIDIYYDTAAADLFVRGIFLRVRDHCSFQVKVNLDDLRSGASSGHTRCTEVQTGLTFQAIEKIALAPLMRTIGIDFADVDTCYGLFERNHLKESLAIKKVRRLAQTTWGTVCFDEVEQLGNFIEIEAQSVLCFSEATDELGMALAQLVSRGQLSLIDAGYNSLMWRERNPSIYSRCPYVLSSDRN